MKKIALVLIGGLIWNTSLSQNTCATAVGITAGLYTVSVVDGTEIPTPICAANGAGATAGEWYTYTASQDYSLTITTDLAVNVGKDTRFHVYSGTCGSFICVSGDDDSGSGFLSIATFQVFQGETYYIAFDNRWDSNGFDFELVESPPVVTIDPPVTFTPQTVSTISGTYRIAISDMNGDFLDDIISVSQNEILIHYQVPGGNFSSMSIPTTSADFLPSWSMAIGDIDKNGFNDLLYGGGSGVTFMMANSTGIAFQEISGPEYVFSQRSNFIDINNDGHLDAFVCHDVQPNVYYINDGNGNLQFNQGGMGDHPNGGNYGSIWVDYDNDGDADLFIAKCRGGLTTAKINELHRNDGNGIFTNVALSANMADSIQTWSAAWNDYDNDGWMDALIGASSTADGNHKFMRNKGDGTFEDITAGSGWEENTSLSIEHISFDFDNDGFTDVIGGGNKIMFNQGDLTFASVPYNFAVGAIGDLNDDGFLDIQNGNTIYYSDGNDNNWIKINLQGIASNYNGIGSRVEIYGAWGKQIRDVQSGTGFRHMHTMNVHFGIGEATSIDSLHIIWPSGIVDVIYNPTINETYTQVEGTNQLSNLNLDGLTFNLFPNPSTDLIQIENLNMLNPSEIYIINQLGNKVLEFNNSEKSFDISQLENGQYFFMINSKDEKCYATSFIKN